jgi:hypothetical protein
MFEIALGIIFSVYFIAALVIVAFIAEYNNSSQWAAFWLVVCAVVCEKMYSISWAYIGWFALAFIPIGLCWSVWRWKRYADKLVSDFNNDVKHNSSTRSDYIERCYYSLQNHLNPQNNIVTIVGWVLSWPVSFINSMVGDFIAILESAIKKYFIGIFKRISNAASKRIEYSPPEEKK